MPRVIVQKWEESERGWGTRPDGYSIHPDEAARDRYMKAYWARQPKDVPDEYSRPHGTPYQADVPDETAGAIKGDGTRFWDNKYPGDGGKDGWVNSR
jgi:hypothetical protein